MDDKGKIDSSKIIFFLGSSGSGKNTIINELANSLIASGKQVIIPRRLITRESHKSEDFISIDNESFLDKISEKQFILYWFIYNTYYGYLENDILPFLTGDYFILLNISRSIAFEAKKIFSNSNFVEIKTTKYNAIRRIENRKRESPSMLNDRIKRMDKKITLPPLLLSLDNNTEEDITKNVKFLLKKLLPN
ncbi:MAG: hypothetical protein ACFFD1_15640 [Candidatus Thorarchaeota archaeon]